MKKIFLLIAILITLLFIGCGNTTTTDVSDIDTENQEENMSSTEIDIVDDTELEEDTTETRPLENNHNTSGRYDKKMYNKDGIQVHIIKNAYGTILRSPYLKDEALKALEKYGLDDTYLGEFTNIYFIESSQLDNTEVHYDLVDSIAKNMAETKQNVDNQLAGEDSTITESTQTNYTYSDLNMTLYAKSSVNTRKGPSTDFEKVGSLTLNQEVKVTGQCNETGWYRINVGGQEMFVSGSYLVTNPIQTQADNTGSSNSQVGSEDDAFADWGTGLDWGGSDGSSMDWSNNYSTGQGSSNIGVGGDGNTGQLLYHITTPTGTFTFTTCQKCFDARCGVVGCSCEAKCHSRQ